MLYRGLLAVLKSIEFERPEALDRPVEYLFGAELVPLVLVSDDAGRFTLVNDWEDEHGGTMGTT